MDAPSCDCIDLRQNWNCFTSCSSSRKPKTNQRSYNCNGAGPAGLDDKPKFSWLETEVDEAIVSLSVLHRLSHTVLRPRHSLCLSSSFLLSLSLCFSSSLFLASFFFFFLGSTSTYIHPKIGYNQFNPQQIFTANANGDLVSPWITIEDPTLPDLIPLHFKPQTNVNHPTTRNEIVPLNHLIRPNDTKTSTHTKDTSLIRTQL